MNEYGAMARDHNRHWRPASYAEITDPESYFTDLGDRVAQEIADLWAELRARAGNPPGEDYLARRRPAERAAQAGRGNRPRQPCPAPARTWRQRR